jgi:hypothetical protein
MNQLIISILIIKLVIIHRINNQMNQIINFIMMN